MMTALVAAGIIAQSDVTAANTYCTQEASRAAVLWGPGTVVPVADVTAALNS
jgi:hypothetical protein